MFAPKSQKNFKTAFNSHAFQSTSTSNPVSIFTSGVTRSFANRRVTHINRIMTGKLSFVHMMLRDCTHVAAG